MYRGWQMISMLNGEDPSIRVIVRVRVKTRARVRRLF